MNKSFRSPRQRLAVGVFREAAPLRKVLRALIDDGFEMSMITLVATRSSLERLGWPSRGAGMEAEGTTLADTDCGGPLPTMRFVEVGLAGEAEPLLASTGEWAGLLGRPVSAEKHGLAALLDHRLDPSHVRRIQRQLETGALTLWVSVRDGEEEQRACRALLRNSSDPVQVHDIGPALQ